MTDLTDKKIVLLTGKCNSSNIVYNELKKHFNIEKVIVENKKSRKELISRRIKKLGYRKIIGQIIFQLTTVRKLQRKSKKRITEIYKQYDMDDSDVEQAKLLSVNSINDREVIEALQKINPDAVVVNGTRIISKNIINAISVKMINTHVGITPRYRGVHGAYWALVNNDRGNCGVTIHLIDQGIDTGGIIAQANIKPTKNDNFVTYPSLQLATALPLLKQAVTDTLMNNLKITKREGLDSRLWTHPTFWQYQKMRWLKGIK